ncbi:MAG: GatB/YqeY domain-containing protein [Nannocystaceae bacterium]|nr:GatB/YqeY domain-containing protein [Nannocystaceae bacterium]
MTEVAPGLREHTLATGTLAWELCDAARRNPIGPQALAWIAARAPTLRGERVVLRGAGEEVFCSGFDLRALQSDADAARLPDEVLGEAVAAMRAADATFVAALGGHAIGAGVELACACDFRLARRGAWFEIPAARLGVVYRAEGLALLRSVFGDAGTRTLVLAGARLSVERAQGCGAVDEVVAPEALPHALQALLDALARGDAAALRGNRAMLRSLAGGPAVAPQLHAQRRSEAFARARQRLQAALPNAAAGGLRLRAMAIKDEIDARLKQARRDRDEPTLNVIGMLKNKVLTELKSGSGAVENDELWLAVLAAYTKQLRKSIPEFEKAGERGQQALVEVNFELRFCEQFLPSKLDEAATEALVRRIVAEQNLADQGAKASGKLMGLLMKQHKDELDSELTRTVVARVLGSG